MQNVGIIVTCEEQQSDLIRLLPELLSMRNNGEYEVIVVDKVHDKDMEEWLKEMEVHYPNLLHTFCSATARGIDIHRLAITLGAKALDYEWLVILPANAVLPGEDWLSRYTACCGDDVDVVIDTEDRENLWHRFTFNIFRRKFSIFHPRPSIILCRRSILFQTDPHITYKRIIRLPR